MTFETLHLEIRSRLEKFGDLKHLPKALRHEIDSLDLDMPYMSYQEKLYALKIGNVERPKCVVCGADAKFRSGKYADTCSIQCSNKNPAKVLKTKSVFAEKYGGHPMTGAGRDKVMSTNLEKYGVAWGLGSSEVQKKRALTLSGLGVVNVSQLNEVKSAVKETKRLEFANNSLPLRLAKIAETGVTPLFNLDEYESSKTVYPWLHSECGTEFSHELRDGCIPDCPKCKPVSKPQRLIRDLLDSCGVQYIENDRTQIKPRELDFYIPSKNLAIEVNGAFWHSDQSGKLPLLQKSKMFDGQLLHFWDFEISDRFSAVRNVILAKLNLHPKIGARELTLREVPSLERKAFFEQFHISGNARATFGLGLYLGDTLLMCASFMKNRFKQDGSWELIRMAAANITVVGGVSRLCSAFKKKINATLVTYADRRISDGAAYTKSGFTPLAVTRPNYFYVGRLGILHRQQTQKHKLPALLENFDPLLSEHANMLANKYFRCLDCGSWKFEL